MFLGSFAIDDYVGIPAATHRFSSGAAYAPTVLTYSIYEEETLTPIDTNVDMVPASPFDSIVGCYWKRRQLTTAAGFEVGKNYLVVLKATVDSVSAIQQHTFQVGAKVDTRWVSGTAQTARDVGASVLLAGDFTATMKTSITQQTGYDGMIYFDTGGFAGDVPYVNGIETRPCSSPVNTHTLLATQNYKYIKVVNASSYTLEASYTGISFIGEKWTLNLSAQQITNCYFEGATVSGTSTGTGNQFTECQIGTVTMAAGATQVSACTLRSCGLTGTFTIGAAGIFTFQDCYNEVASANPWILDFDLVGATTIRLAGFSGSVEVRNMGTGDVLVVSGDGAITLTAPCAGTLYVRGDFELTPGTATTTIIDTSRWNENQVIAAVTGNVGGNVTGSVGSVVATVTANVTQFLGTALTETVPGYITAAFKKLFDVVTPVFTAASVNQTADLQGSIYSRLGAPAGASVSADIAAVKAQTAAIETDTQDLQTQVGVDGAGLTAIGDTRIANLDATITSRAATGAAMTLTAGERNSIADAYLDRADAIEVGLTPRQAERVIAASAAGKLSGAATATTTIRNAQADSKNRIVATTDADGNRTAVTLDVT